MAGGRHFAHLDEGLEDTFDSGIRKRERDEHTRQTSRPPPSATADLVTLTREDGTIPDSPFRSLLTSEEQAAIEEARALYMQSQALPPEEFQELMDLLGDVVENDYGAFDPNAVLVLGKWSELAEFCLGERAGMLIGLIDGTKTIAEIVEGSELPVREALDELQRLIDHGAVESA